MKYANGQQKSVTLGWTPNSETYLSHYNLYRDVNSGTKLYLASIPQTDSVYIDNQVELGRTYYYKLTAVDSFGNESTPSNEVMVTIGVIANTNNPVGGIPTDFALKQNYPNPFNLSTTIQYELPQAGWVQLVVYDILGKEIRRLVDSYVTAGTHQVSWDGLDQQQRPVASGLYFYQMTAENFRAVRRMVIGK